jgi:hypothetical protein
MAAELPPSRFKTTGSLTSLRRLMGWQALLRAEGCEHTPAAHRLALPVGGPTLDRTEWGGNPGLEPGFDPVLDRIQYLVENGLTSLMVLHDFLSKRLTPLQDRSHRPAWMYTGVNNIMRLDRGPGSSLGDTMLAASLKVLTTDPPSTELMTPTAGCEPLCVN